MASKYEKVEMVEGKHYATGVCANPPFSVKNVILSQLASNNYSHNKQTKAEPHLMSEGEVVFFQVKTRLGSKETVGSRAKKEQYVGSRQE